MATIKVLVVDDYEPFRRVVRLILELRDDLQIVGEASDGLEAVQKAKNLTPDLILLDLDLPTFNGIQVARRVRDLLPRAKVLFVSVESSPDVVREALSVGGNGFISKLHVGSELLPAIDAGLSGEQFVSSGLDPVAVGSYRRVDEVITSLKSVAKMPDLLHGIVDAGMEIMGADFGNMQAHNKETKELIMIAQRGFGSEFVKFFEAVRCGDNCCGTALKNRKRVIVEDVATDPLFRNAEDRRIMLSAGVRACQSTPLFTQTGELFGMLNTCSRRPFRPSDDALQALDLLARQALILIYSLEASRNHSDKS